MRSHRVVWLILGVLTGCGSFYPDGGPSDTAPPPASAAPFDTGSPTQAVAARLRAAGPDGLKEALTMYDEADRTEDPAGWEAFVDTVAAARDTSSARLYWHTDLEAALAESKRRGVPVLSLRMLGDLRDALSCANSRFFRTTLYADPAVSRVLREDFVLHWSSERPVPVVEISFGDGRVIETTTAGNSIHYLLDERGRVLDAAPGLYSPAGFVRVLEEMRDLTGEDIAVRRAQYRDAPARAEKKLSESRLALAMEAQQLTASKARVEVPLLDSIGAPNPATAPAERIWAAVAERQPTVEFSEQALALIRRDRPRRPAETEEEHERRLAALTAALSSSVAEDELINENQLRPRIHAWLADPSIDRDLEAFNARVYRDLFLTPASDPWLGLVDETTYDGLMEGGIIRAPG